MLFVLISLGVVSSFGSGERDPSKIPTLAYVQELLPRVIARAKLIEKLNKNGAFLTGEFVKSMYDTGHLERGDQYLLRDALGVLKNSNPLNTSDEKELKKQLGLMSTDVLRNLPTEEDIRALEFADQISWFKTFPQLLRAIRSTPEALKAELSGGPCSPPHQTSLLHLADKTPDTQIKLLEGGLTPLMIAAMDRSEDEKISNDDLKLLVSRSGKPDHQDVPGSISDANLKLLISHSGPLDQVDNRGITALGYAMITRNLIMAAKLISLGARALGRDGGPNGALLSLEDFFNSHGRQRRGLYSQEVLDILFTKKPDRFLTKQVPSVRGGRDRSPEPPENEFDGLPPELSAPQYPELKVMKNLYKPLLKKVLESQGTGGDKSLSRDAAYVAALTPSLIRSFQASTEIELNIAAGKQMGFFDPRIVNNGSFDQVTTQVADVFSKIGARNYTTIVNYKGHYLTAVITRRGDDEVKGATVKATVQLLDSTGSFRNKIRRMIKGDPKKLILAPLLAKLNQAHVSYTDRYGKPGTMEFEEDPTSPVKILSQKPLFSSDSLTFSLLNAYAIAASPQIHDPENGYEKINALLSLESDSRFVSSNPQKLDTEVAKITGVGRRKKMSLSRYGKAFLNLLKKKAKEWQKNR